MDEVHVTARFRVHDGQIDRFKELAQECRLIVREKDEGTLQYDPHFREDDHGEWVFIERYVSSDAVLAHLANLGDRLPAILDISDFSAELFGTPSSELLAALDGLDVRVFKPFPEPVTAG